MPEHIKACYLIIDYDVQSPPSSGEIAKLLEKGTEEEKIDAMKTLILMILQDEHFPRMIMTVVQHAMRVDSKDMKKLLMIYWESIEKTNPDGTIKDEMVMLCNALRNDLLNPNEFIRARTLRLVSKMRYREMMDTLLQPVLECLTHRHPYVRRNAVMCVYSIYLSFGEDTLPDAVERIDSLLSTETDISTRRNALLFLFEASPSVAMRYLNSVLLDEEDSSSVYGTSIDILQLVVLDELKKVCKANPLEKGKYMKSIFSLATTSKSQSVLFECASTIIQLTNLPNAIKLAVSTYLKLLCDPSADNNMRLLLVENLVALKDRYKNILQDQAVEILRALSSPSNDIRSKCIELVLQLLTNRNVEDIIRIFKKELLSVQGKKEEILYQDMLVNGLHTCAVSFPGITEQVGLVEVLMDSCLLQEVTDTDVSSFIQQIIVNYPTLRPIVLNKLYHIFPEINSPSVYRTALWILAEFSEDPPKAVSCILAAIGDGPYFNKKEKVESFENSKEDTERVHRTIILPDGTYGTQIISSRDIIRPKNLSGLRKILTETEEVDYYLVTVIAKSLVKLFFKIQQGEREPYKQQILSALCGIVQIRTYPRKTRAATEYSEVPFSIDAENFEQVVHCIRTITGLDSHEWVRSGLGLYERTQTEQKKMEECKEEAIITQPDDIIAVKQLRGREGISDMDFSDDTSMKSMFEEVKDDFATKITNVRTLTGLDDVVYAECSLKMNHYDIILEFGVHNRSNDTIKNLALEIAVEGELKLVEKPQSANIGPMQMVNLRAVVKVSSTQAGIIFGNLTYDTQRGGNVKIIPLNEIVIDSIEYICPAACTEAAFRKMWQEFKWENPVVISSPLHDLMELVRRISAKANMQILTPESVMRCSDNFLVCNLYAKSRFNEDALMNISIETSPAGIVGNIRIRAKTEGMAKCLGERISLITSSNSR